MQRSYRTVFRLREQFATYTYNEASIQCVLYAVSVVVLADIRPNTQTPEID